MKNNKAFGMLILIAIVLLLFKTPFVENFPKGIYSIINLPEQKTTFKGYKISYSLTEFKNLNNNQCKHSSYSEKDDTMIRFVEDHFSESRCAEHVGTLQANLKIPTIKNSGKLKSIVIKMSGVTSATDRGYSKMLITTNSPDSKLIDIEHKLPSPGVQSTIGDLQFSVENAEIKYVATPIGTLTNDDFVINFALSAGATSYNNAGGKTEITITDIISEYETSPISTPSPSVANLTNSSNSTPIDSTTNQNNVSRVQEITYQTLIVKSDCSSCPSNTSCQKVGNDAICIKETTVTITKPKSFFDRVKSPLIIILVLVIIFFVIKKVK